MMDKALMYKILAKNGTEKTATGNPAKLEDTTGRPFRDLKVYGWSKQETTTGANLLDIDSMLNEFLVKNDDGTYTMQKTEKGRFSKSLAVNITAGSVIHFTAEIIEYTGTYIYPLQISTNATAGTYRANGVATARGDISTIALYQDSSNAVGTYTKFKNPMLYIGGEELVLPYEPYTGGKPSPSPDYPQEIVSAGMKWSTGKNLLSYPYQSKDGVISGITFASTNGHVTAYGTTKQGLNFTMVNSIAEPGEYAVKVSGTVIGMRLLVYDKTEKKLLDNDGFEVKDGSEVTVYFNESNAGATVNIDADVVLAKLSDIDSVPFEPYTGGVPALYGDKVNIAVRGRNLFDDNKKNYVKVLDYYTCPIILKTGATYRLSAEITGDVITKCVVGIATGGRMYKEFTTLTTCLNTAGEALKNVPLTGKDVDTYLAVYAHPSESFERIFQNVHVTLEETKTSTNYEVYHTPQIISINTPTGLPAIPVSSGGNYTDASGQQWIADYVDFGRGKYVQRVWENTYYGTENWRIYNRDLGYEGFYIIDLPEPMQGHSGLCNYEEVHTKYRKGEEGIWIGSLNAKNRVLYFKNSRLYDSTLADNGLSNWKSHLAEHPLTIMTYLDTPIEHDLTPEEIQAYKALATYSGTTIVENDAECYMEVTAGGADLLRAKKLALLLGE